MTLGRKSISTVLSITNTENPKKPHEVVVQANKNYGICDMSPRVGEVLSDFQGRQINNGDVISELESVLYVQLNPKKRRTKS